MNLEHLKEEHKKVLNGIKKYKEVKKENPKDHTLDEYLSAKKMLEHFIKFLRQHNN